MRDPVELDGHYVRYHRDLFLQLLLPPPARTLDLGCGEGRLARHLTARGYDVVAVDASPTMVAAAREAAPEMEIHRADAASVPLPAESFDVVVAFMSLQDADDLPGAAREAARVLARAATTALRSSTRSTPPASSPPARPVRRS